MLGKLLSTAVKVVNAPLRATENLMGAEDDDEDRPLSSPLNELAKELDKADE